MQKVKITLTGWMDEDGYVWPKEDASVGYIWRDSLAAFEHTIEHEEPKWWLNDVVIDTNGRVLHRLTGTLPGLLWQDRHGVLHPDTYAARPLTLLVRDGKKV